MRPSPHTSRPPVRPGALLAFGWSAGAACGALCGLAEGWLAPLGEPLRVVYTVGADGALGSAWGFLAGACQSPV